LQAITFIVVLVNCRYFRYESYRYITGCLLLVLCDKILYYN